MKVRGQGYSTGRLEPTVYGSGHRRYGWALFAVNQPCCGVFSTSREEPLDERSRNWSFERVSILPTSSLAHISIMLRVDSPEELYAAANMLPSRVRV